MNGVGPAHDSAPKSETQLSSFSNTIFTDQSFNNAKLLNHHQFALMQHTIIMTKVKEQAHVEP
ncbi:hypothetical protein AMR76_00120 [Vibrio furnissii]|uniref:Uncharacterized protein n=1 Tax=Vibrio furnissii TaxID=29494 RepID=A0A0Q2MJ71_VIBFU|nr:hypothetical protein AMR76_00120 [Vibrio furnissii]